ncbi:MAG: hypothetical protein KF705_08300 [Phycisphaeraceae bacterium]|nr:hypothetical protein [Phycisphaeraceae bacterium]
MGKCCIRFKKLEDLALDVIGEAIRRVSAKDFIAYYERSILSMNKSATAKRAAKEARRKRRSPSHQQSRPRNPSPSTPRSPRREGRRRQRPERKSRRGGKASPETSREEEGRAGGLGHDSNTLQSTIASSNSRHSA